MAGLFCYKVTFHVLKELSSDIKDLKEIVIKLIDSNVTTRKEICKLEQRLAEMREQHRNYTNLFNGDSSRSRVHKPKER